MMAAVRLSQTPGTGVEHVEAWLIGSIICHYVAGLYRSQIVIIIWFYKGWLIDGFGISNQVIFGLVKPAFQHALSRPVAVTTNQKRETIMLPTLILLVTYY